METCSGLAGFVVDLFFCYFIGLPFIEGLCSFVRGRKSEGLKVFLILLLDTFIYIKVIFYGNTYHEPFVFGIVRKSSNDPLWAERKGVTDSY